MEGILPNSSYETPCHLDIYNIHEVLADRQTFVEPTDADLTNMERAYIASQIASKNELDQELQNNLVCINRWQIGYNTIYLSHNRNYQTCIIMTHTEDTNRKYWFLGLGIWY